MTVSTELLRERKSIRLLPIDIMRRGVYTPADFNLDSTHGHLAFLITVTSTMDSQQSSASDQNSELTLRSCT